jgi:hypothetical protein
MSITNYFGKPRAKYVPYKSPYSFEDLPNAYGGETRIPFWSGGRTLLLEDGNTTPLHNWPSYFPYINRDIDSITYGTVRSQDDMKWVGHEQYKLENVQRMFNNVLTKCMEWVAIPFWTINKIVPAISMVQILILKIADTDKHVEHLEKMFASVCEDNTLLNNRIKALEQRLERQTHIPVAEPIVEHITVAEAVLKC